MEKIWEGGKKDSDRKESIVREKERERGERGGREREIPCSVS